MKSSHGILLGLVMLTLPDLFWTPGSYALPPLNLPASSQPLASPPDSLVNYCTLVRAAYFYGQKAAAGKVAIAAADVDYFNSLWRQVFDIPYYQQGITSSEFTGMARFREGNHDPFPPSALYHRDNPDGYLLFHVAKEVGKIKSTAFASCPACIDSSITRINALLKDTRLHAQISRIWLGTSTLKKISSTQDVTDFWNWLKCLTIDDRVNPKSQPFFISLPPVLKCPDTTKIHCKEEIKPKVSVGYRHCEIGGKVDTIGPGLVKGIDNCPGAVYRYKFVARDNCLKTDSAFQYFIIQNDAPQITCPKDTVVTCIKDLVIRKPKTVSSCSLATKFTTYGPLLVSGHPNCPDAKYELEYTVEDTCGRQVKCVQHITIRNNPPTIKCPPDTIVACSTDIRAGTPVYTVSCSKKAEVSISSPKLVSGKADCPGAVYEVIYSVKDSCDRTASCKQKFTINNKGPEIDCPQNVEVQCYDDIHVGQPASLKVSCDLGYKITMTDPKLIMGKHDCSGAVYSVHYTVTDDCGRTDACEQLFTILQPETSIQCPPDLTVQCSKDIKPAQALVKTACKHAYTTLTSGPKLVSGKEDCPGAKYTIQYTVSDECGVVKECIQWFTIDNPGPKIECGPAREIMCEDDFEVEQPVPVVSCSLEYDLDVQGPDLVSGRDNCDGAVYRVRYVVTDECGRSASCDQLFTARIPPPEISCPPDSVAECADKIQPGIPEVRTYCDLTFSLHVAGPTLISGIKDCPGAIYAVVYTATDECGRSVSCTQRYTIENQPPRVYCYPEQIVDCEADIQPALRDVSISCDSPNVQMTGPLLLSGKMGCPNAVYEVTFSITDACGRKDECKQKFRIRGDDLTVLCPPDTTVRSKADIRPRPIAYTTSCDVDAVVTSSPPRLVSGVEDQPGAVYEIIYTIADDCGQRETCVQRFTIVGLADNCRELCDCVKELKNVSLDLLRSNNDRLNRDVAALIKKYGCKKVKEWAQSGLVELWNAWSTAEILGAETGIAGDIARRGNINIVMQNLENINKVIEVLEEAINGEPKKTLEKISELLITDGVTYLTGSGTPALVFTSIKSLGEFAQYLNNEILIINIKTLAEYADRDPCIFDPDHYLLQYAKIREVRPGDRVTWNDVHNPFRIAIYEYAQHRLNNPNLPAITEIWTDQQKLNTVRTATYTMLKEVCQYWCYKLTLNRNLNKLIQEQSLLMRFRDIIQYINRYDCQGEENPCTDEHAQLVEVSGRYECRCESGYKWDPGKIRCIPWQDCAAIANSEEVYYGDHYACECINGYEWNADHTRCVVVKPDCPTFYPNTEAVWNTSMNRWECNCLSGYEWNSIRTGCELPVPDCQAYYPNTEAVWNPQTNRYECHCRQGYQWNATRTGCDPLPPDCNAYYPNTVATWNAQTNQYECNCLQGYQWNATRTGCELAPPDCQAYYPNTIAVWNAQTNQYECNCLQGYQWNATRTGCEPAIPDCQAYYPNTVAVWNVFTNQYECNCLQGYQWNATRTGCELAPPDCPSYYPNTVAVWNAQTNQYECNCLQGYQWNATRTGCEPAIPDCQAYYPNTVAVWNVFTNQYECNCLQGYVWNATRTGCVSSIPDCTLYYPNTTAVWDANTNQYLCDCLPGYTWNITRTGCEAGGGTRDDPNVNPQYQRQGECNATYGSGANEPEQYTIDVHRATGSLVFTYDTETIKDRIHVYYAGRKILDTGCVGARGSQTFVLDGYNTVFKVVVDPLCDPTESNTSWSFSLGCPQ